MSGAAYGYSENNKCNNCDDNSLPLDNEYPVELDNTMDPGDMNIMDPGDMMDHGDKKTSTAHMPCVSERVTPPAHPRMLIQTSKDMSK
jgi:hypothetical protein